MHTVTLPPVNVIYVTNMKHSCQGLSFINCLTLVILDEK